MKPDRTHRFAGLLTIIAGLLSYCSSGQLVAVRIQLSHVVGTKPLVLDTAQYTNGKGQEYTVTKFKYYISNIRLRGTDGTTVADTGYYLVNDEEPSTMQINIAPVPGVAYSAVAFTIGVDSLHNCSGAQSGALDPVNAMFWTWNNGYIFLKLEGKANASTAPGHLIEYHIGGYKPPANCIREVSLQFARPFVPGTTSTIHIRADVAQMLNGPTVIDFSQLPSVTDYHHAATIADNYAGMFSLHDQ